MTTLDPTSTALPAALAEPTTHVPRSWIALIFSANLGVWMAFLTPVQILLPQQIAAISPVGKEAMLSWVFAFGALAAIVVNPVAGALSDRTCLRIAGRELGRRHVWTAASAVLGALALLLLAVQDTVAGVVAGWVAAQVCITTMLATLTAAVPDRVPVTQRGTVSGWVSIPQALGLVVGAVLVTTVVTGIGAGYAALSVLLLALALPFAGFTADDPLPRTHRAALRVRDIVRGLWVSPRRHPDFAWAWGTRFLVQVGNALGTLYLLYFLQDKVRHPEPEAGLLTMILLYTGGLMATAVVAGRLSDRLGVRKPFVISSGIIMAVAALLLAIWPVWSVALGASVLLGAGYGVYLAVDAALVSQVLPQATDRAKDLGVINIANSAPQVLGPALAAPIVVYLGGYSTLYALTAAVTLLGSVLVTRVRSVR